MKLTTGQSISILIFIGLFGILYFGCDTKDQEQKAFEKSRAQNLELVSTDRLVRESRKDMTSEGSANLMLLEEQLRIADNDSIRIEVYKALASLWYMEGKPLISGYYAEQIAKITETGENEWSITGTTYAIAAQHVTNDVEKKHAVIKSRSAFENVISLNSENIESRINLALSYVDLPDEENPMKGILMLLDLNKKHPDNIPVLLQLGKLGLETNQLDKSSERFSKVLALDPNNKEAHCLLAEVYKRKGEEEKALVEQQLCDLK